VPLHCTAAAVAPFTGAWIETGTTGRAAKDLGSRPSRARGLKPTNRHSQRDTVVAPFTGAWIETLSAAVRCGQTVVAPFTGAWIETLDTFGAASASSVAPFTGAWIETQGGSVFAGNEMSRPSRARGLKPIFLPGYTGAVCRALHGRVD